MSSDKQQSEQQEKASELEIERLDEVVGGRKALHTMAAPKPGGAGVISDPCSGGE